MNKSISAGAVTVIVLFFSAPKLSLAENWYVGGNLHQASVSQWRQSSYENKLATAANWALMQPAVRKISSRSSTMNTVKPYAEELVGCIDRISVGSSDKHKTASSLADACIVFMGW